MADKDNITNGQALVASRPNGFEPNLKAGTKTEMYEVTDAGVFIRKSMMREEWLTLASAALGDFEHTRDGHLSAMLRVGDVLAYGEREYGEDYAQAIDSTRKAIRLSVKTLQNVQWICGSVKPETRRLMLTLSHHEAVAKLTDEEQEQFLKQAEEEELSVAELRKRVKAAHPNPNRKTSTRKAIIDLDSEDGLLHAAEKIVEFFETPEEQEKPVCDWTKERGAKWFPTVVRLFAVFAGSEEVCRETAREIASFLENPDNGPLKDWSEKKKARWAGSLASLAKSARRMGVATSGVPKKKEDAPE